MEYLESFLMFTMLVVMWIAVISIWVLIIGTPIAFIVFSWQEFKRWKR